MAGMVARQSLCILVSYASIFCSNKKEGFLFGSLLFYCCILRFFTAHQHDKHSFLCVEAILRLIKNLIGVLLKHLG